MRLVGGQRVAEPCPWYRRGAEPAQQQPAGQQLPQHELGTKPAKAGGHMCGWQKQLLAAHVALCAAAAPVFAAQLHDVHVEKVESADGQADWRYIDSAGRERLFRGINVV